MVDLFQSFASNASALHWFFFLAMALAIANFIFYWYRALVTKRLVYAISIHLTPFVILVAGVAAGVLGFYIWPKFDDTSTFSGQLQMYGVAYCAACGIMSGYTFLLMAADKLNAITNRRHLVAGKTEAWRIPERLLHKCEFFGGWAGSFLAQQFFRHKVSKPAYRWVFWSIFATHVFGCVAAVLHLAERNIAALIALVLAGLTVQLTQAFVRGPVRDETEDVSSDWRSSKDYFTGERDPLSPSSSENY